jgi:hypothetical protein
MREDCPRGGMVDAADLKSVDFGRAGSSPAEGTTYINIYMAYNLPDMS